MEKDPAVEIVASKILLIRGRKVLLDRDLAEMYGVAVKVLNQAVRRNLSRFPADFMFQVTRKEAESLRSQIGDALIKSVDAVCRCTLTPFATG